MYIIVACIVIFIIVFVYIIIILCSICSVVFCMKKKRDINILNNIASMIIIT